MVNFFRGRSGSTAGKLDKELAALEEQVRDASPGYETQFLNRAGNLCVDAGESARALGYFGRAIDAYLESGRFSAAEVLCNKVLQISPNAVRARCTLAWLALGKGVPAAARSQINEYVAAAERAGQDALAAKQLYMMAEATTDEVLRDEIANHLLRFEATEKADAIFGLVYAAHENARPGSAADEGKLWAKLLRAALMGPRELEQQPWPRAEDDADALPSLVRQDRPSSSGSSQ